MALKATIYKIHLSLSDMDRGCYGEHALTIAKHPSETEERMMNRVLAFALYRPISEDYGQLEFAKSMWDADEPDLWHKDLTGQTQHWIDVGLPDEARIKRVAARSIQATIIAFASSTPVWWESLKNSVIRLKNLTVVQITSSDSQALAALAQRNMALQIMVQDGTIWLSSDNGSLEIQPQYLKIIAY
ncbi:MAG: hypothetical protein RL344_880 [Pseudomonadota bacterium]|jgi:uncharacterized protein YaeQ